MSASDNAGPVARPRVAADPTGQGTRESITNNVSLIHHHFQQPNGRWVAELEIMIDSGSHIDVIQGLEPRDELDFATEAEAMSRNRTLAHNWLAEQK